jgi:hypothetical protein
MINLAPTAAELEKFITDSVPNISRENSVDEEFLNFIRESLPFGCKEDDAMFPVIVFIHDDVPIAWCDFEASQAFIM